MKRNILMSLVLVLMVGLLCGCGGSKEKTNNNSNGGSNGSSSNSTASKDKFSGVYVAEDDFNVEGLIVIKNEKGYNIIMKDPIGAATDTVSASDVNGDTINGNMYFGDYSIKVDNGVVTFNAAGIQIENLKMTKSTGTMDGIYQNSEGYISIYTLKDNTLRITHTDYDKVANSYTLKFNAPTITNNQFTYEDIDKTVAVNAKKDKDLSIEFSDKDGKWNSFNGTYVEV